MLLKLFWIQYKPTPTPILILMRNLELNSLLSQFFPFLYLFVVLSLYTFYHMHNFVSFDALNNLECKRIFFNSTGQS